MKIIEDKKVVLLWINVLNSVETLVDFLKVIEEKEKETRVQIKNLANKAKRVVLENDFV